MAAFRYHAVLASLSIFLTLCCEAFQSHPPSSVLGSNLPSRQHNSAWPKGTRSSPLNASSDPADSDKVIWKAVLSSIRLYKAAYGDTEVPPDFLIPKMSPWPEKAWGMNLGKEVAQIRSTGKFLSREPKRRISLERIGFRLESENMPSESATSKASSKDKASSNDERFKRIVEALVTYKSIHGDLLIPQPFVVPQESPLWPKELWGLRLGARVNAIRSQGTFVRNNPARKEQLDEIGFVWNPQKLDRGRSRMDETGLSERASVKNREQKMPPQALQPPVKDLPPLKLSSDDGRSTQTQTQYSSAQKWGFDGKNAESRSSNMEPFEHDDSDEFEDRDLNQTLIAASRRAAECGIVKTSSESGSRLVQKGKRKKDIPWYNDDFGSDWTFEDVVEALSIYKHKYGNFSNLTAEDGFVVPDHLQNAPEAVFDMPGSRSDGELLLDEGEGSKQEEWRELNGSYDWPEHLAGMALGQLCRRIRDGSLEVKHVPTRKSALDAIEFDWGDPKKFIDVPFEKAVCAMYAYYLIRGDMFVEESFVMPDEEPWPQALAGYEIGKAVKRIRQLQNFFEAFHPEKMGLLRMIDFVWFPFQALPIDPNEPETTPEMHLLLGMGHPDYAKMRDMPFGLTDKLESDGPFHESSDPKQWWRKWHNWDYVKDYWYGQGRRDNAAFLRNQGYPQMAIEHEKKYGPGLFANLDALLEKLDQQVPMSSADRMSALDELSFFGREVADCSDLDIHELEKYLDRVNAQILKISALEGVADTGSEESG